MHITKDKEAQQAAQSADFRATDSFSFKNAIGFLPLICALAYSIFNFVFIGLSGNFPLNDDVFYALPVKDLLENGELVIKGSIATCYLHILTGAAVCSITGFSYEVLRTITTTFAVLTVFGIFIAVRELGLRRSFAGIFALAFAVNPLVVNLSSSFMTDIPYVCFTTFYLYFTIRALKRNSRAAFTVASLFLVASLFVRQISILFLVPNIILAAHLCIYRSPIFSYKLCLPLVGYPLLAYFANSKLIVSSDSRFELLQLNKSKLVDSAFYLLQNPLMSLQYFGAEIAQASLTIAFISMPAIGLVSIILLNTRIEKYRSKSIKFASLFATFMVLFVLIQNYCFAEWLMPYKANLFKIVELGPYTLLGTTGNYNNLPLQLTVTAMAAALGWWFTTAILSCTFSLMANVKSKPSELYLISCLVAFFLFTALLFIVKPFDRYYLCIVPVSLLCLAVAIKPLISSQQSLSERLWLVPIGMSLLLGAYSSMAHQHYMSWNKARWTAIELLHARGIAPDSIDGGAEYRNVNKIDVKASINLETKTAFIPKRFLGRVPQNKWRWWPVRGDDYLISHVPTEHYATIFTVPYWSNLHLKELKIYVQKRVENF